MPVEFSCPECRQRMRTPDESAGKKARCPQCEAVVDVPEARVPEAPVPEAPVPEGSPFGTRPSNPYQAPEEPGADRAETLGGEPIAEDMRPLVFGPPTDVHPGHVTLDDMVSRTWALFMQRIGHGALFALILLGVNTALSVITGVINFSTQFGAQAADAIWIAVAGQAVSQILSMVFQSWLTAGAFLFTIHLVRYGSARYSLVFQGHPYLVRLFLFNLLIVVVVYGIPALLAIPGFVLLANQADTSWIVAGFAPAVVIGLPIIIWLTLTWYLTAIVIVERNQTILEAMKTSSVCMRGNRLIVLAGGAIVGLLALVFILITCFVGIVLVIPYVMIFSTVVYMLATGQGHGNGKGNGKEQEQGWT